ncbi:MAG: 3-hydroxyacyl-CoA dehydrogenase family protein, partial [Planctomycetota bacterium]
TGVFALYDLIGLDLMLDVVDCLRDALPADDPFNQLAAELPLVNRLVEQGYTGNKGAGGFYRRGPQGKEAVDLRTGEYRGLRQPAFNPSAVIAQGGLRALLEHESPGGRFAAHVLGKTLAYAASLVPDVSAQVLPVDEAMKLGFNWTHGPFELLDQLSVDWFVQRLRDQGEQVPDFLERLQGGPLYRIASGRVQLAVGDGEYAHLERLPGVQRLADVTRPQQPLASNSAATLWDLGDGVACVEFHTKANALEQKSMDMLREATSIVGDRYQALVIHNDAPHFSMGANLPFFLQAARDAAWDSIEQMLAEFQQTCYGLKYAPFPVIGAPAGMALGGGCEVLLHCDALYAHANTVCGLVETSVGLIPAGGGCKEMLWRWSDAEDLTAVAVEALRLIGGAVTAGSPVEAVPMRFFREQDRWVMNRDRVLLGAKSMALAAVPDYAPPAPAMLATGGAAAWDRMMAALDDRADELTSHDRFVNERLATVLVGGDRQQPRQCQEDELFALEREMFRKLIETPETQARIDHTLRTGKPLRN